MKYLCKECNAKVVLQDNKIIRECKGHEDKGIVADMGSATLTGTSKVK